MPKHPLKVRTDRTRKGKIKGKVLRAYKKGRQVLVKSKPKVIEEKPEYTGVPRFSTTPTGIEIEY